MKGLKPILTLPQVKALMEEKGPKLSLYLPTHWERLHKNEDHVIAHNLLRKARQHLIESGLEERTAKQFIKPAQIFFDKPTVPSKDDKALALLLSADHFHYLKLPFSVTEKVLVAENYYLLPLLTLILSERTFFVLALSQNSVRFFRGNQYQFEEISPANLPKDLAHIHHEVSEKHHGYHSVSAPRGPGSTIHHGLGEGVDSVKNDILRFFRAIDKSLHDLLKEEKSPLILAGVEYLHPLYREVNHYAQLSETGIFGEPDHYSKDDLHARAWEIVKPLFHRGEEEALAKYENLSGRGKTSTDLRQIAEAAIQGKIETFFVAEKFQADKDELVLNDIALQTYFHRGQVVLLEPEKIPQKKVAAAILRY